MWPIELLTSFLNVYYMQNIQAYFSKLDDEAPGNQSNIMSKQFGFRMKHSLNTTIKGNFHIQWLDKILGVIIDHGNLMLIMYEANQWNKLDFWIATCMLTQKHWKNWVKQHYQQLKAMGKGGRDAEWCIGSNWSRNYQLSQNAFASLCTFYSPIHSQWPFF